MNCAGLRFRLHLMVLRGDQAFCFPGSDVFMLRLDFVRDEMSLCFAQDSDLMPEGKAAGEYVEKLDMIVVFGGLRDLRVIDSLVGFDVRTETWSELTAKGVSPPPRYNHCSCMPGREEILFFGGNETRALISMRNIYCLKCTRSGFIWSEVMLSVYPQARANASMNCVGHRILIFGGYPNTDPAVSNELFVYDLHTKSGRTTNVQPGTTYHTAAIVGEKMVVIGGLASMLSMLSVFRPGL